MALDEEATVGELIQLFETAGVSRIPIYHETLDDPRGMVHVKDVFAYAGQPDAFSLEAIMRKPLMVAAFRVWSNVRLKLAPGEMAEALRAGTSAVTTTRRRRSLLLPVQRA